MDARAHVERGGSDIVTASVRRASHEHRTPVLPRTPFQPVDVLAIDPDAAEPQALRRHHRRGNWRRPGTKGALHVMRTGYPSGRLVLQVGRGFSGGGSRGLSPPPPRA